jgi:hypothetical protein
VNVDTLKLGGRGGNREMEAFHLSWLQKDKRGREVQGNHSYASDYKRSKGAIKKVLRDKKKEHRSAVDLICGL